MNTKQFQYVLVLAQEGSFSRAADALGITQPSLSQYVKKIEKELGAELFDRASGDVRITDAGHAYLDAGRRILELEHQLEVELSDLSENRTGSLIIGAAPYRAAGIVPVITREFQKLHPGMHLVVREGTTAEISEDMAHGAFDLALTLLPIDQRLFSYEKVAEEELLLAVPADFPLLPTQHIPERKYPAVDAGQLNEKPMVMLTDAQFMQHRLEELAEEEGISLHTAAVVKSLEAQIAMVRAGVGMALMPSGIERFCFPGEVVFYSFLQPLPKREVVVMWRKDRKLSQAARELKEVIRGIPW